LRKNLADSPPYRKGKHPSESSFSRGLPPPKVFVKNLWRMVPITRFHFQPVGDGRPGPIYRKLLNAWSEEVGVDIVGQARDYAELAKTWKP